MIHMCWYGPILGLRPRYVVKINDVSGIFKSYKFEAVSHKCGQLTFDVL
jgi:hypothetical protein